MYYARHKYKLTCATSPLNCGHTT